MIRIVFVATVALTVLAGCGKTDLSDQSHSVEEYMADDRLSADTIEACRAKNEAEYRLMAQKPACANVREAEDRKSDAATAKSEAEYNASMEKLLEERRRNREARARKQ